jgi:hypothetical protein
MTCFAAVVLVASLACGGALDGEDDPVAQYDLGVAYANGDGVRQNPMEAARWYRLAAEQGNGPAQFRLGEMYMNGRGVPKDDIQAYMWFNLAASRLAEDLVIDGIYIQAESAFYRDLLGQDLTRTQRGEAQRLSREWDEAHPR